MSKSKETDRHRKNRSMLRHFLILTAAACALASCGNQVFDKYEHTSTNGWEKNDALSFSVPKAQVNCVVAVDLGLRINNLYPFMQLTLIVEQRVYPSNAVKTDTINYDLIDNNGYAKGHGISHYQYNFHVSTLSLNRGDSLNITVRHDMKREILPGISDVGIKVNRK